MTAPRFPRIVTALTSEFPGLLPGSPLIFHRLECPVGALAFRLDYPGQLPVLRHGLFKLRFAALGGNDEPFDPGRSLF